MPLMVLVVVGAQVLEGGHPQTLLQPTAALVVFGGTLAALCLGFPAPLLWRTIVALRAAFGPAPVVERGLIQRIGQYANRAKRRGPLALEAEVLNMSDPFLARAIGLVVDGVPGADLRQTLRTVSQAREEADEACAHVLEAAAGYAPTLGILGAVLGLIHVMESLATPANIGTGIAVAFVAMVYGVGSANLVFLPLAARLRGLARAAALDREIVIEGTVAIQQGLHPRLVEAHLDGLLRAGRQDTEARTA
jgi:chemotaxis protein MotA